MPIPRETSDRSSRPVYTHRSRSRHKRSVHPRVEGKSRDERESKKNSTMFVTLLSRAAVMVRSTIRACQGEKPPDAAAPTVFLLGCRLSRTSEDIDPTDEVESMAGDAAR